MYFHSPTNSEGTLIQLHHVSYAPEKPHSGSTGSVSWFAIFNTSPLYRCRYSRSQPSSLILSPSLSLFAYNGCFKHLWLEGQFTMGLLNSTAECLHLSDSDMAAKCCLTTGAQRGLRNNRFYNRTLFLKETRYNKCTKIKIIWEHFKFGKSSPRYHLEMNAWSECRRIFFVSS